MRWLTVLLLCGFLASVSVAIAQSPHASALQATPPPDSPPDTFCSGEQRMRGYTAREQAISPEVEGMSEDDPAAVLYPEFGAFVAAVDVEDPVAAKQRPDKLSLMYLTLPPDACRFTSNFYPAAIITVTAGTMEIYVEPGEGGAENAPPPLGWIWRGDAEDAALTFPGPITVNVNEWVTLQNRAHVGFRNSSSTEATVLVAAIRPTDDRDFARPGCNSGCSGRNP